MFENCKYKWDYIPTKEKEDAYEELIASLTLPEPSIFKNLSNQEKDTIVENLIKQIRKINVFPIFYFNQEGVKNEILSVVNKTVTFNKEDNLETYATQGSVLLDYLFPNLHHIIAGHYSNPSIYEVFYDDKKLAKCLTSYLEKQKIHSMKTAFFSEARYKWNMGTNFAPIRAKAIFERFCPKGGTIYDYSAGFGGRMLGALSSSNDYTYIAVEPNSDTYYNLLQLGEYIEDVVDRKNTFKIYQTGSEDFVPDVKIDFAFSCPPFFDLERYSDEETQSIVKYPNYEDWLEFYARPTIKNCYTALKDDGIYAVDLMNYSKSSKPVHLIEDWLRIAEECGFYLRQISQVITRSRKKNDDDKEKILVFTKNKKVFIKSEVPEETKNKYKKKIEKLQHERMIKAKTYCRYNINGELEKTYSSMEMMAKDSNYTVDEIKQAIKSKKRYNQYYFKVYNQTQEVLKNIPFKKVICKIKSQYFDSYASVGRYLDVSRQAVQQAHKRGSTQIQYENIEWL